MTQQPTTAPVFPPGRYGRRREPRRDRWLTYVVAALVVLAGGAIAVKLYRQYALAPYQATVTSVGDMTSHSVTITFQVHKPAGKAAVCTVRARNYAGAEVGRAQVPVPAGSADQTTATITYTLSTTDRPIVGEVPSCGPAS